MLCFRSFLHSNEIDTDLSMMTLLLTSTHNYSYLRRDLQPPPPQGWGKPQPLLGTPPPFRVGASPIGVNVRLMADRHCRGDRKGTPTRARQEGTAWSC